MEIIEQSRIDDAPLLVALTPAPLGSIAVSISSSSPAPFRMLREKTADGGSIQCETHQADAETRFVNCLTQWRIFLSNRPDDWSYQNLRSFGMRVRNSRQVKMSIIFLANAAARIAVPYSCYVTKTWKTWSMHDLSMLHTRKAVERTPLPIHWIMFSII